MHAIPTTPWSHSGRVRLLFACAGLTLAMLPTTSRSEPNETEQAHLERLLEMDFQELAQIRLTSAARKDQTLVDTTAAVTVIDQEQIRRSGLTSIPELLRLVPGLNVARINASNWAITARGFNAQYSNKLLVLMDGRTLYTPLFAGVNWNRQDVPLADVERIEVIRGPGATLWGANAVNGVINIITKKAADTQGTRLSASAGNHDNLQGSIRHGGKIGATLDYRIYAKGFDHDDFLRANNQEAHDDWQGQRSGFRADWTVSPHDQVTFQGDLHTLDTSSAQGEKRGGHLLTRWSKTLPDARNWSLQLFFDRTVDTTYEQTNLYDLDWQAGFRHHDHAVMWGAGYRLVTMELNSTPVIQWAHPSRADQTFSLFAQDEITWHPDWRWTLGTKLEHNDHTGVEWQPNTRLLWRVNDGHTLWGALSRAVRTPSRVDADFKLAAPIAPGTLLSVAGNPRVVSETLLAYELGYRAQFTPRFSLELATFFNRYDHLVSTETLPTTFFPVVTVRKTFDNQAQADTYGLESAVDWRATDIWRVRASHTWLKMNLDVIAGSTDTISPASADDVPRHQWQVRSLLDLPYDLELDTALYYTGRLNHLSIPAVTRLDARLGWRPVPSVGVSLMAQNLLDDRHPEFTGTSVIASEVPRAFLASLDWNF
ncbi:MAG: TonB-dependent receptor [Magnetococcales bacterium]|nr:TonB-dependent receptor [Magnetococcales bacterium]